MNNTSISIQLAKHLREVHFGGNWTFSNLKEQLSDVSWEEAQTQVYGLNTIHTLLVHCTYYVGTITRVLQGGELNSSDKESFVHPPLHSQKEWEELKDKAWADAEVLAALIEKLPDTKLAEVFKDPKYGTTYRNLAGLIEHFHYHLGQMALIKKIIRAGEQQP